MPSADCTDTIHSRTQRPLAVQAVALVWFIGSRLAWWVGQGCEAALSSTERARQRRQLAELSDAMLRDIGRTRSDVEVESRKPFWRP